MTDLKAKYKLHAKAVDRIAIVDSPAVPDAMIVAYKRRDPIVDVGDLLPIAKNEQEWNAEEALTRVQKWAGEDKEKFQKAFVTEGLLFADVIDGNLTVVPKALVGIQFDGSLEDLEPAQKAKAVEVLKKYNDSFDGKCLNSILLHGPISKYREEPVVRSVKEENYKRDYMYGFNNSFISCSINSLCQSLRTTLWGMVYSNDQSHEVVNGIFPEFERLLMALKGLIVSKTEKSDSGIANDETMSSFLRSVKMSGIDSMVDVLAYYLRDAIIWGNPKDSDTLVGSLLNAAKEYIITNLPDIKIEKMKIEKAGRVISTQRLNKLKSALGILTELVNDAESYLQRNTSILKENPDMELTQIVKSLEEMKATVEGITKGIAGTVQSILVEKGLVLTDEQIAEKMKLEKMSKEEKEKLAKEEEAKKKSFEEMQAVVKSLSETVESISKRFNGDSQALNTDPIVKSNQTEDVFGKSLRGIPLKK